MDKRYHTVRMDKAPQVGEIFSSSLLKPAPAPDKWWKVMLSPAWMVSGAWAVTLQECIPLAPKPDKGPVGEHVHALLRATPPEPTLGQVYSELMALRVEVLDLKTQLRGAVDSGRAMRVALDQQPAKWVHDPVAIDNGVAELLRSGLGGPKP